MLLLSVLLLLQQLNLVTLDPFNTDFLLTFCFRKRNPIKDCINVFQILSPPQISVLFQDGYHVNAIYVNQYLLFLIVTFLKSGVALLIFNQGSFAHFLHLLYFFCGRRGGECYFSPIQVAMSINL